MASNSTDSDVEFTPRRNPKRFCSRQEPWKFDDDDDFTVHDRNDDDDDFKTHCSTPSYPASPSSSSTSHGKTSNARSQSSTRVWNRFTDEYDPDNDVFIHDVISVKFDTDKLKSHIKQLMTTTGIPPYKRAINKCIKQQYQAAKMRRTNRKRTPKKRTPQKMDSDSELDVDTPETPSYPLKCTPESTLRAMIYTRDLLNRMKSKRKKAAEEAAAAAAARERNNRANVVESEILKGVVAFVDVISHEDEDISSSVRKELEKLGAVVVPTLTKNDPVSIILFNDGHVSTYQKAKKRGIPLVSVLWIEECRRIGTKAPESEFPPSRMDRYESPACLKELKKRKFMYASERMNPRKQRKRVRKNDNTPSESPPESQDAGPSEFTPKKEPRSPEWLDNIEGVNGMMKILVNMTEISEKDFRKMMEEPNDSDKYETSPLPVRLLHKLVRDLPCNKASSANEPGSSTKIGNLEEDSVLNVESDSSSILASPLAQELPTCFENKEFDATDGSDNIPELSVTKESLDASAVPRRMSSRPRSARRRLTY